MIFWRSVQRRVLHYSSTCSVFTSQRWSRSFTTRQNLIVGRINTSTSPSLVSFGRENKRSYSCRNREDTARLRAVQRWLDEIVIGERLCPFAARVRSAPRLRLRASSAVDADEAIQEVTEEAALLAESFIACPTRNSSGSLTGLPETSLLVFDSSRQPFTSEWDAFVRLSWRLQAEAIVAGGFSEMLQIVLFHPLAVHSSYAKVPPDPGDYTVRAPYPTVHLLREADILKAVRSFPEADQIPYRNKMRLREIGLEMCQRRLDACAKGFP
eukprot:TRINITY_DN9319_c0_g1_i1.p1 TRINITY_DN9319_c0_g1~~TRINITY_DN9319_c0_g1_i1.p1  ORF type:complete len:282 (-),score=33.70 TRINITY_DN9319_c0_g1_i1:169-975(-)